MTLDARILEESIRTNKLLEKALASGNSFNFVSNGQRIGGRNDIESEMMGFNEVVERGRKMLEGESKKIDSFFKGVGRSLPLIKTFADALKKNNTTLNKSIQDQSEKYKQSARAMDGFVKSVGANNKKVSDLNVVLDKAEDAAKKLQQKVQKRAESEQKVTEIAADVLKKEIKIKKDFSNLEVVYRDISRAMKKAKKEYESADRKDGRDAAQKKLDKLSEAMSHLQNLKDIPETSKELREVAKQIDLSNIKDQDLKEVLEKIKKDSTGNTQTTVARLSDVSERLKGLNTGLKVAVGTQTSKMYDIISKTNSTIEELGRVLVAGFGEAATKQFNMVQTRQMRAGGQFQQIIPALTMGMSEADLLRTQDENRFLIRRMALAAGNEEGAANFIGSGEFREIQDLGEELGLIGIESADMMLKIAENLRVVGITATRDSLEQTVKFIKESHKEFGITQKQMVDSFRNMTDQGLMAMRFRGDGMDPEEAMQNEVEARMRLARVLNQDIAIQEKRVRQMASLLTGDPVETFRKAMMTRILATNMGFDEEEASLLQRYVQQEDLGEDQERARGLYERLRRESAGARASEITGGNIFGAVIHHIFMTRAGIDIDDATREAVLYMGADEQAAASREGVNELHDFARAVMRSKEMLAGLMQSGFGVLTLGALKSASSLFILAVQAAFTARSLGILGGASLMRMLRRAPAVAGGLMRRAALPVAATVGVGMAGMNIMDMNKQHQMGDISDLERRQGITREAVGTGGRIGGMIAGAKVGGMAAGAAGGPLALVTGVLGAITGGIVGGLFADSIADAAVKRMENRDWRDYISERAGMTQDKRRSDRTLSGDDRAELGKIDEEKRRIENLILEYERTYREEKVPELEDKLSELNKKREEILYLYTDPERVTDPLQMEVFGLLNTLEESRGKIATSGGPRFGGGRHITESNEAMSSLVNMLGNMDEDELTMSFDKPRDVEAVIRAIENHHSKTDEMEELVQRLTAAMEGVEENTERSARAEEQQLSKQDILIRMAGEEHWQDKLSNLQNSLNEMVSSFSPST